MAPHYGPNSQFAILDDPSNPLEEPVFTKDGIHILSQIRTKEPEQQLIIKLLAYIGRKIDRATGDGTTTGILLAAHLMYYLESIDKSSNWDTSYYGVKTTLSKLLSEFTARYQDMITTVESLVTEDLSITDVRAGIAYFQTLTSSHGDKELALVVSKMFRLLPEESLDSISFTQAGREHTERLSVVLEPEQYRCKADLLTLSMLDKEANSLYHSPGGTVMLLYNGIIDESPGFHEVKKQIVKAFEDDTDLTVLTPSACGVTRSKLISFIKETRVAHPEHSEVNIGIFFPYCKLPTINDTVIISLLGGIQMPSAEKVDYLYDVDVKYHKGEVLLDNLYDLPDNNNLRPHYQNPDYPMFNGIYQDLTNVMEKYREGNIDGRQTDMLREYVRLKNNMLLHRRVTLLIGGTSYENVSMYDVVEDSLAATRRAVKDGFVPGVLYSMMYGFTEVIPPCLEPITDELTIDYDKEMIEVLREVFVQSIRQLRHTLASTFPVGLVPNENFDGIQDEIKRLKDGITPERLYVLQPKQTDLETLRRVEEVVFKFFNRNKLIIA